MSSSLTATRPPKRIVTRESFRIDMAASVRSGRSGSRADRAPTARQEGDELLVSEDALRPHDHENDQEEREEDHPVLLELPQTFREADEEHGPEDRARDRPETADDDHDDDLEGLQEGERVRVHVHEVVGEETPRHARHGG